MKLSIVIPAYNAENYIERAIASALIVSDAMHYEIIVVNDGSIDRTHEVVQDIVSKNANVILIDQSNSGAMVARARGAMAATGEYVIFCDADDTLETKNIIQFVEYAFVNDADIVVGCSHDFSKDGAVDFIQKNKVSGIVSSSTFIENILKSKIIFGPACKLFNRRIITEECFSLPNDIVFNEDLYMNIALAANAKKIIVDSDLVVYNHLTDNPDSITHTKSQNEEQWIKLFQIILEKLNNIGNIDKYAYIVFVCDRLRTNYYNRGRRFKLNSAVLQLLNGIDSSSISFREKLTIELLRHPRLTTLYYFIFKFRSRYL